MNELTSNATNGSDGSASSLSKRALLALRDLRAELDAARGASDTRIAIVGMSCRFPGAPGLEEFWTMLRDRRSGVTETPAERWDAARLYHPEAGTPGKIAGRWGGFLDQLDCFDAAFFGISPREAPHVDPRQRKVMEIAWEALEDAGIPPLGLAGSATGVYIATLSSDYDTALCRNYGRIAASTGTGTANSILANRLSYLLDLHGPSLTLDTACSGSLLTVELACRSLRSGESSLALAGGVSVNLLPKGDLFFSSAGALSPTGECKTFDAAADGIVRSEGAGIVVLKRLADAIEDGDRIYAVIRGGAVNHDGASNGIMAPNGEAQKRVLREAYKNAGVSPGEIDYIEAHGTGTPLGDPVEVSALAGVLAEGRNGKPLVLGSLKTNAGHMEAAAGIASVIKAALSIHRRSIPPNRNFREWNPRMPEMSFPVEVPVEAKEWAANGTRRLAGVSAFSFGGTNAHLVLENAPEPESAPPGDPAPERQTFVLPLSAKSERALEASAEAYRGFLANGAGGAALRNICYTAAVRRSHHSFRFAIAASSVQEMSVQLANIGTNRREVKKLAFVFSGQGSHWAGMGEDLLRDEPAFRTAFERCDRLFRQHAGWSVIEEISSGKRLDETDISQAAVFSFQVALFQLWRSWGIEPDAVIGQSLGEVAAAYAAGALSLEAAVAVVHHRSRLMKTLAGQGKTAVVGLATDAAQAAISAWEGELSLAGNSGPETTVVSGSPDAVAAVVLSLREQGVFAQEVAGVDLALHSPRMQPLRGELERSLGTFDVAHADTAMMSTVTRAWMNGNRPDAAYWGRNLCEPFQLAGALEALIREGFDGFLEISPHAMLKGTIRQALAQAGAEALVLASCRRGEARNGAMLSSLAALYSAGKNVNWSAVFQTRGRVVALPAYPWQRERYWFDQLSGGSAPSDEASAGHPFLGKRTESALPGGQLLWEREISLNSPYYLSGHKVLGQPVFPGAGYAEAALAALAAIHEKPEPDSPAQTSHSLEVSNLQFHEGMALSAEALQHVQTVFVPAADGGYEFQISARKDAAAEWTRHASGRASAAAESAPDVTLEDLRTRCREAISAEQHYEAMAAQGLEYSANFRAIAKLWRTRGEALAELQLDAAAASEAADYCIHPILLDAAFQTLAAAIDPAKGRLYSTESYVPRGIDRLRLYASPGAYATCVAQLKAGKAGDPELSADLQLIGADGQVCAAIEGLRLAHVGAVQAGAPGKLRDWLYELCWEEKPRAESSAAAKAGAWTIFADNNGFGEKLAEKLRRRGLDCTLIPPQDNDLEKSLANTESGIVYLRGLDDTENPCAFPLRLVKALAERTERAPALWIATCSTQPVDGYGIPALTPAAELWGFARVMALENPELFGGILDLQNDSDAEADRLADEILSPDADRQIAFREGKRYAARLRSFDATAKPAPVVFRNNATYLITGGLGGLGLAIAGWMIERGARRFILAGRTPLPSRREWESLPAGSSERTKAGAVREFERRGASVHLAAFDVANTDQVKSFIDAFHAEGWPAIRGVIHAAGVVEDQFMVRLDEAAFARVLRPKVKGTLALHQATPGLELDFFTLFSSISSVLGQFGQAHYAAGNAFMDHFAHWRRSRGLPATSINWGPWAEVGLFARLDATDKTGRSGVFPMLPEQALRAMERLHALAPAQATVVSADWTRMPPSPLLSEVAPEEAAADSASDEQAAAMLLELLLAGPEDRQRRLEEYLIGVSAGVLRLDPAKLDAREPLTSYGMDSIMVVDLKRQIEKSLNLSLPIVELFTGSIVKLAEQLAAKLANDHQLEELLQQVENMSPEEMEALLGNTKNS